MTQYDYSKTPVYVDRLTEEIKNSPIATNLDHIDLFGTELSIFFLSDLSGGDVTLLNNIVTAHAGIVFPVTPVASVAVAVEFSEIINSFIDDINSLSFSIDNVNSRTPTGSFPVFIQTSEPTIPCLWIDTLVSLTGYKGGVEVTGTTTPVVVTSGKTYRIICITLNYTTLTLTPGAVRFTLRANLSGVVAITSPAVCTWEVGEPTGIAPVAGKKNTINLTFPDGIEFAAGTGIGISQVGLNTVGAKAAVGYGQLTINGFEY